MKSCSNVPVVIQGYDVIEVGGGMFLATKENETIRFLAEGRDGGLYFKPLGVSKSGRRYTAWRFLQNYVVTVREISFHLADNDYLWDYIAQTPFLETRKKGDAP